MENKQLSGINSIYGIMTDLGRSSEQLKLLPRRVWFDGLLSVEEFDVAKLFVGDAKYADMTELRQERLYTADMHLGVFHAGAMAHVDRELKHGEAVLAQVVAKKGVVLLVFLCLGGQVEENKNPHYAIFTESIHSNKKRSFYG